MKLILEFDEFKDRESVTRTKGLSDEEFLIILKENCKNFSLENDQLWRTLSNKFGKTGLFFEGDRKGTIGVYSYKQFFDDRKDYPVPRYKSLIGSTSMTGANLFGSVSPGGHGDTKVNETTYRVIPFDNINIVFAGCPDIAMWAQRSKTIEFKDELFMMKQYEANFKVPVDELNIILNSTPLSDYYTKVKDFGFEFFTNGNCLLLHESKIEWLKSNI